MFNFYKCVVLAVLVLTGFTLTAQTNERYARVQISLKNKTMSELAAQGLETDHGIYLPGRSYTADIPQAALPRLRAAGFVVNVLVPDVQQQYLRRNAAPPSALNRGTGCVEKQSSRKYPTPVNYSYGSMGGYHTYAEMLAVLDDMAAKYPKLITYRAPVSDTIKTHGGRPLWFVKLSDNPNVKEDDEKEVLYTALHHAREPNGMSQMLFYMWYLLENYATNEEVRYIVDNLELYFVPCINPDGYTHNETIAPNGGGFWRKNRRDNGNGSFGVDLNRNYGYEWGHDNAGSSPNSQSDTYRGPAGFSEPETRTMRDFCLKHNFLFAQNYHTFSNLLIYPWAYSDTPADSILVKYARLFVRENNYHAGTASETVGYPVNGSSDDWMYGVSGVFSFTPEVGLTGFWPTFDEIEGLNRENVWLNLATALCALRFGELTFDNKVSVGQKNFDVDFEIQRYGLLFGPMTVSVKPLTANIVGVGAPKVFNLQLFESQKDAIAVTLSPDIKPGSEVVFLLQLNNGVYTDTDTLRKIYVGSAGNADKQVFVEDGNNLNQWENDGGQWGPTTKYYVSPPSSLTDSPGGDYASGAFSALSLKTPVKIPANALGARLRFFGRWEMEEDLTYVQVYAAGSAGVTTALCGLYTEPGSIDQAPGEPVYDGFQLSWVEENMNLSEFIGQSVTLKFFFFAGGQATYDGFYFDDLRIEYVDPTIGVVTLPLDQFGLDQNQPNPANTETIIRWDPALPGSSATLVVTDGLGKVVLERPINLKTEKQVRIDTRLWAAGVYTYRLRPEAGASTPAKKMIVVH